MTEQPTVATELGRIQVVAQGKGDAFRDLLVLVQEDCCGCPDCDEEFSYSNWEAAFCRGTGFVLRIAHCKNADIGETEGRLLHALSTWEHLTATEDEQVVVLRQTIERWLCTTSDHRIEALSLVADWLEGLTP